jgi:hypothetical protein
VSDASDRPGSYGLTWGPKPRTPRNAMTPELHDSALFLSSTGSRAWIKFGGRRCTPERLTRPFPLFPPSRGYRPSHASRTVVCELGSCAWLRAGGGVKRQLLGVLAALSPTQHVLPWSGNPLPYRSQHTPTSPC